MRTLPAATAALILGASVALTSPALAHGDRDRMDQKRSEYDAGLNAPVVMSPSVSLVDSNPGSAGISGCFMKTAPLFVMSGLDSVIVHDVSNPLDPKRVGTLPSLQFENEAMNCGERKVGRTTQRFALIGVDLYQASPGDITHVNDPARGDYELIIVDVTDPTTPRIRSRVPSTTSTHTVSCVVDTACRYVYSAGDDSQVPGQGSFSIFDLSNLDRPVEVDSDPATAGLQPFRSDAVGWGGHKWNFDGAGRGVHTGAGGTYVYDVSNPIKPVEIANTGAAGDSSREGMSNGFNNFIHHNSFHPNAAAFRPDAAPSLKNGNILLVTEEDYENPDCSTAGSFQTWHIKRLDGSDGSIVPLAKVELADLATYPLPVGAFCSAHWFDYHQSGIVSVGYYGGGTQFIDVNNPLAPKSHGFAWFGASEVWDSYWVPVYSSRGVATGKKTNVAYSVDLVRGLDVLAVDVEGDSVGAVPDPTLLPGGSGTDLGLTGAAPIGALGALGAFLVVMRRRRVLHQD
ncbi:MAG: hypothetical protein JWN68_1413 [Nocardioides sp.]|jgi:hypothetical protein|uniref:hypothetical protein n=1 Tax=Nocardioides sp. TaxID=35761 RepID=UPI00263967D0|nr:hypothetical protein [Nocardioides sp.]MCW2833460.1 hypothetical protein [Nocardioides sp.]